VRHPAGELAQRLHALGLRRAGLRLLARRHLLAHPGSNASFRLLSSASLLASAASAACAA
jgi:hypothetical protein